MVQKERREEGDRGKGGEEKGEEGEFGKGRGEIRRGEGKGKF